MTIDDHTLALLRKAYKAGFDNSDQGYNGEHPFEDQDPEDDADWVKTRDEALRGLMEGDHD